MEEFSGRSEPRTVPGLFDVAATEQAEKSIDAFIEKRAREARDANVIEELWGEQDRRDRQRKREENRIAWISFHRGLARSHAALSESHEERAARLAAHHDGPSGPEAA